MNYVLGGLSAFLFVVSIAILAALLATPTKQAPAPRIEVARCDASSPIVTVRRCQA
jgi:hypothetical protein